MCLNAVGAAWAILKLWEISTRITIDEKKTRWSLHGDPSTNASKRIRFIDRVQYIIRKHTETVLLHRSVITHLIRMCTSASVGFFRRDAPGYRNCLRYYTVPELIVVKDSVQKQESSGKTDIERVELQQTRTYCWRWTRELRGVRLLRNAYRPMSW
jgi:hypothetical protein